MVFAQDILDFEGLFKNVFFWNVDLALAKEECKSSSEADNIAFIFNNPGNFINGSFCLHTKRQNAFNRLFYEEQYPSHLLCEEKGKRLLFWG